MLRRIFLDLDDTCNTLAMHVLACAGCQVSPTDYRQHPLEYGYDIVAAANHLLGETRYADPAAFWCSITRQNWVDVPPSEIFPWILHRAARVVGRENVCIATRPTKCPECVAGKLEWIHAHFPPWMHRQYAITPRKRLFARPDALLIDDVEENILHFEAEGGHGVLIPRPWNRLWGANPFDAVERQLENLF